MNTTNQDFSISVLLSMTQSFIKPFSVKETSDETLKQRINKVVILEEVNRKEMEKILPRNQSSLHERTGGQ